MKGFDPVTLATPFFIQKTPGYVSDPPGWSHDGSRETSAMIKATYLPKVRSSPHSPG